MGLAFVAVVGLLIVACHGEGGPATAGSGADVDAALTLLDEGHREEGLRLVARRFGTRAEGGGETPSITVEQWLRLQGHLIPLAPEDCEPGILAQCTIGIVNASGRDADGLALAREPLLAHLERDRQAFGALYALGSLAMGLQVAAQAEVYFARAVDARPDRTDGRLALASALMEQGKVDEARPHYDRILELDAGHHAARYRRARILLEQDEDVDAALVEARIVAARASGHDAARAETLVGQIVLERGDLQAALQCYRRAVEASPESAAYQLNLGRHLFIIGEVAEASPYLRRSIELRPEDPRPHVFLAQIAEHDERLEDAARQYQMALSKDPKDPLARYRLDLLRRRLGQPGVPERAGKP